MSTRLESGMNEDNESTEEGKQTSYPAFTRTVPNSSFHNSTSPNIPNLNGILPLPRSLSPFPSELPSPPLSGISVLPQSAGSRRAGTGGKFVVGYGPGLRMVRQGEACRLVWDARKGCVPYLFLIIRLVHRLAEKIIP